MTRVYSFDVFDTLLTRAVGSPLAAFTLLGRSLSNKGVIACTPAEFADARREAEVRAYRAAKSAGGEVRLAAIHDELGALLGLEPNQRDEVLAAECELETQLLRAVPDTLRQWPQAARRSGSAIAFLSDTPLPLSFMRDQLTRHGIFEDGDILLVSSECQSNKADGAMYRELVQRTGVRAGEILHVGNHEKHDLDAALREGLQANPHFEGNLSRYEEILESFREQTGGLSSVFAGAARLARLQIEAHGPRETALRDVAAGVVAPLLGAYVIWVLGQAQRRDIATLWFLGRDGQILLELAEILAPALGVDIDTRYLHASRQAWNLPAVACGAHAELDWIWDRTDDLSVKSLLARVGLEPDAIAEDLADSGLPPADWTRPLRATELELLRATLQRDRVQAHVMAAATAARERLTRYLDDVGVLGAPRSAIVELAGHGNLQESLTAVMTHAGAPAPEGFYFALMPDQRDRQMPDPVAFLDDAHRKGLVPGFGVIALEAFCAADHGTLRGFTAHGDTVHADYAAENRAVLDWGLPLLRRTVTAWARALLLDRDLVDPDADVRAAVTATLRTFWTQPTRDEAATWGAFPWEDGHGHQTRYLPLAQPHTWADVARTLVRRNVPRAHRAAWRQGAMALTPRVRRFALRSLRR